MHEKNSLNKIKEIMIRPKDRCGKNEPKYHREIKRDNDKYREIKRRDYDQKWRDIEDSVRRLTIAGAEILGEKNEKRGIWRERWQKNV